MSAHGAETSRTRTEAFRLRDLGGAREAGYRWRLFRETARSRTRRAALPVFAAACAALRALGLPPSLALPYFNLVFRKTAGG